MTVRYDERSKELTLFFPERVDSFNSEKVKEELGAEISKYDAGPVVIDMSDTVYVSSAGLRVLLALYKSRKDVKLTGVSSAVYDILDMTGFAALIKVERKMKEYSVDGLEIIGRGATSAVYRIDPDTILKVFGKDLSIDVIEREMSISKAAFISGISTAIPYEIVKVGDSFGTVYEMIKADTLSALMHKDREALESNAVRFGSFMREMHAIGLDPKVFPSARNRYIANTAWMAPALDDGMNRIISAVINAIPEKTAFSHGDFHPNNVMIQNDELILIDMGESACGSPIFDIMAFGCARVLSEAVPDELMLRVMGMTSREVKTAWDVFLRTYFNNAAEEELALINRKCLLFSSVRALYIVLKIKEFTALFKGFTENYIRNNYSGELLDLSFLE